MVFKYVLCQVWLKLTHFGEDYDKDTLRVFSPILQILPLERMAWALKLIKPKIPKAKNLLYAKLNWNWPSGQPFLHWNEFRYYGCELVIPEKLKDMKVLDLGSESGRNCFALRTLVGPNSHLIEIDMSDEQVCRYWAPNRISAVYLYIN